MPTKDFWTNKDAVISTNGLYRHVLMRRWGPGGQVTFVMLNPSTADATKDDPTIRKCIQFAKRRGAAALVVVNLFDFRTSSPSTLRMKWEEAYSVYNDEYITTYCKRCVGRQVFVAWGLHGNLMGRDKEFWELADRHDFGPIYALRLNKDGSPEHPLYVPYETKPVLLRK